MKIIAKDYIQLSGTVELVDIQTDVERTDENDDDFWEAVEYHYGKGWSADSFGLHHTLQRDWREQ